MRILSFRERYVDAIYRGTKETTIRLKPKLDRYYQFWAPGPRGGNGVWRGTIEIPAIEYVHGRDLTPRHAQRDGFSSVEELLSVLSKYNRMPMEKVLAYRWSIHDIQLVDTCPQCLTFVKALKIDEGYTDIDCPIHGKGRWSH